MQQFFGLTPDEVKKRKRRLGLTWLQAGGTRPELPTAAAVTVLWESNPSLTVVTLANEYKVRYAAVFPVPLLPSHSAASCPQVSARTMRSHLHHIGFAPSHVDADDGPVMEALEKLLTRGWCTNIGNSFAEAELRTKFGITATTAQIRRCLRRLDPTAYRARAAVAAKTKYQYDVAGPRSLGHADAHEKLAENWGIWVHILVDGYSRYIVYLEVTTDKKAATVGKIFRDACDALDPPGWFSRVRWDKGSENAIAMEEQILRMGPNRGAALAGRSCQNCRAEYIWNFVKKHVTSYFRQVFFEMMRRRILDISSPTDLHALHAVFVPQVRHACDEFREMWNHHRIRGERTVRGRGGGIPAELFTDPVLSRAVLDDNMFSTQGEHEYGVDEPFRSDYDDADISFCSFCTRTRRSAFSGRRSASFSSRLKA